MTNPKCAYRAAFRLRTRICERGILARPSLKLGSPDDTELSTLAASQITPSIVSWPARGFEDRVLPHPLSAANTLQRHQLGRRPLAGLDNLVQVVVLACPHMPLPPGLAKRPPDVAFGVRGKLLTVLFPSRRASTLESWQSVSRVGRGSFFAWPFLPAQHLRVYHGPCGPGCWRRTFGNWTCSRSAVAFDLHVRRSHHQAPCIATRLPQTVEIIETGSWSVLHDWAPVKSLTNRSWNRRLSIRVRGETVHHNPPAYLPTSCTMPSFSVSVGV